VTQAAGALRHEGTVLFIRTHSYKPTRVLEAMRSWAIVLAFRISSRPGSRSWPAVEVA